MMQGDMFFHLRFLVPIFAPLVFMALVLVLHAVSSICKIKNMFRSRTDCMKTVCYM